MTFEQRLERRLSELEHRIETLESNQPEEFVSPQTLARIMECSTNHIYVQVREVKIKTARGFEKPIRIPMSQFSYKSKDRDKAATFKDEIAQMRQVIWG